MEILSSMKSLEALNLYRTLVTNSGLAQLQALKHLTDLDVRYSRVTFNGVETLRAALPQVKIRFDGAALPKTKLAGAAMPADSSEQAIAAWVKRMGGTSEMTGDQVVGIKSGLNIFKRRTASLFGKS